MIIKDKWVPRERSRIDLGANELVIFGGSFENRSYALADMIDYSGAAAHILLSRNPNTNQKDGISIEAYENMTEGVLISKVKSQAREYYLHYLNSKVPYKSWKVLYSILKPAIDRNQRILVDITTMQREMMGMVVALVGLDAMRSGYVAFGYVPAVSYDDDKSDLWLSRGVRDIRAIIGYEGKSGPAPNHLVLLSGFELDRTRAIIERLEPGGISIARTKQSGSTHPKFAAIQKTVVDEIARHLARPPLYVDIFPKSCSNTYGSLREHVDEIEMTGKHNIFIAPLNTKPSSLAAFLIASERPGIQVVYAEPHVYNEEHYSDPQEGFYEIRLE